MNLVFEATTGATSAVLANTIVYPLDVVTSRIQVHPNHSKREIIQDLIKNGIQGLYPGLNISLIQTFMSNFGYFWFYALIKRFNNKYFGFKSTASELLMGAIAGGISRSFTTPISVVTTRKQTTDHDYARIIRMILADDGLLGFWRGYLASLVLTINPAITYGLFSRAQTLYKAKMTPIQVFILGAITKSCATVVTYPYILCKTRMQAGTFDSIFECFKSSKNILDLYSGLSAQLSKAVLCQAFLFAFKDYLTKLYSVVLLNKH